MKKKGKCFEYPNAIRIKLHNKSLLVGNNPIVENAIVIELTNFEKREDFQVAHYRKIRKNTFLNVVCLKDETAKVLMYALNKYFKNKSLKTDSNENN